MIRLSDMEFNYKFLRKNHVYLKILLGWMFVTYQCFLVEEGIEMSILKKGRKDIIVNFNQLVVYS